MKFSDSGLPNDPIVEKAFNYSFNNVMAQKDEELKDLHERIGAMFDANLARLEAMKGKIPEAEYNANKTKLNEQIDKYKQMAPALVAKELVKSFQATRVPSAKEVATNADNASPELIASALLVKCVRSPIDYLAIEKEFGKKIATVVADVGHLDAYPVQRAAYMKTISDDSKLCYMAQVISSMDYIGNEVAEVMKKGGMIELSKGQEQESFADLQALWGLDKKLDQRFIASFNKMTKAINSKFEIRVNAGGKPELADRTKKPAGPKPPAPGIGGDDIVF